MKETWFEEREWHCGHFQVGISVSFAIVKWKITFSCNNYRNAILWEHLSQMNGDSFGMSLYIIVVLGRKEVGPYVIIIKVYQCSKIISSSLVRGNLSQTKSEQVNVHFYCTVGMNTIPGVMLVKLSQR